MKHWIVEGVQCRFCGKVIYETREDAEYKGKSYSLVVYPYECKYGNGWHLSREEK